MNRTGPLLFVALLVAAVVVAAVVVHARTPDLALQVTHLPKKFSPNGDGTHDVERIRFYVRESEPHATVEIVGPNVRLVRVLYRGPLVADRPVSYIWNGRTRSGELADPRDHYRLRVLLPSHDRDMVFPQPIKLQETAPR